MRIYISGISGTGMGPLALMAKSAGYDVYGSDLNKGAVYDELVRAGIEVYVGEQDGKFLQEKMKDGIDWFVHTSALPEGHAELKMAREAGIKCTKRDDFTAFLVDKLGLKMVAVAGTHGKTTTTAMIIWAGLKLGLPISYIVGTTLGFAPSGSYKEGDRYFIYEADEYDKNFLKYHPWLSLVTIVSYDHPDIYPTQEDYINAFEQFKSQSGEVVEMGVRSEKLELAGEVRRKDAGLAMVAIERMIEDLGDKQYDAMAVMKIMNEFPGVGRRFERIADGVYTDYAHHPEEVMATIDVARDEAKLRGKKGVVVVYQPHQNTRQHEVREGYKEAFIGANKIYWLPTYLTREDPNLSTLMPSELVRDLVNKQDAIVVELSSELEKAIKKDLDEGYLVVLMSAGPADSWLRQIFSK